MRFDSSIRSLVCLTFTYLGVNFLSSEFGVVVSSTSSLIHCSLFNIFTRGMGFNFCVSSIHELLILALFKLFYFQVLLSLIFKCLKLNFKSLRSFEEEFLANFHFEDTKIFDLIG
jgi:phage-related protein